jgi:hypothetical protein
MPRAAYAQTDKGHRLWTIGRPRKDGGGGQAPNPPARRPPARRPPTRRDGDASRVTHSPSRGMSRCARSHAGRPELLRYRRGPVSPRVRDHCDVPSWAKTYVGTSMLLGFLGSRWIWVNAVAAVKGLNRHDEGLTKVAAIGLTRYCLRLSYLAGAYSSIAEVAKRLGTERRHSSRCSPKVRSHGADSQGASRQVRQLNARADASQSTTLAGGLRG